MSTHTPGPWANGGAVNPSGEFIRIIGFDDYQIADVIDANGYAENEANVHLICAAPDLLEALLIALPYVTDAEGFPEQFKHGVVARDVKKIRAAIAKAEGKS
jgi:hypothetical protein